MEEVQDDLQAKAVRYIVIPSMGPVFRGICPAVPGEGALPVARAFSLGSCSIAEPSPLAAGRSLPDTRRRGVRGPVRAGIRGGRPAGAGRGGRAPGGIPRRDGQAGRCRCRRREAAALPGRRGCARRAQAQVESARGDTEGAGHTLASLMARLSAGGDRFLPWTGGSASPSCSRAGNATTSRGNRCAAAWPDANEARLRSLSAGSLYDLLVLAHSFGQDFSDPALRALALGLLPGDLRNRL